MTVPAIWEVEYTPKVTMKGGQVVYLTPRGNVFIVSFGELNELAKQFGTLDEYGRSATARLPITGYTSGKLSISSELQICGHRAILSNFQGNSRTGEFADIWIADLWCKEANRHFSIYGELGQRGEFSYFPRVFRTMAESLICHGPQVESPRPGWQLADVGFSPRSRLWFVQLFDQSGLTETYQSREIMLRGGTGVQYQWPQMGPRPMWHVRERIFPRDVDKISYDEQGTLVVEQAIDARAKENIPDSFDSITYAYSLSTARGFVEFRDRENKVTKRIDDRWIAVENLTHNTVGTFPDIRLKAKREDIGSIVITNTCVVIQGRMTTDRPDDSTRSMSQ